MREPKPERKFRPDGRRPQRPEAAPADDEHLIEGRNAVTEALKSGRTINKVFIVSGGGDQIGRASCRERV